MSDPIHNPAHYTAYPVQPIAITRYLGFCMGNVIKYVMRAPHKGGVEDLGKALRYLDLEAETPGPGVRPDCLRAFEALRELHKHLGTMDDTLARLQRDFLCAAGFWLERQWKNRAAGEEIASMRQVIGSMIESLRRMETQP